MEKNIIKKKVAGIYKIQNKINGKVYIGQSIDIFSRWATGHTIAQEKNKHLKSSYLKYGFDNFSFEILRKIKSTTLAQVLLNCFESYYIEKYQSMNPSKGYNKRTGGDQDYVYNDEVKAIMSMRAKNRLPNRMRSVINLTTMKVYKSIREASDDVGGNVYSAVRKSCSAAGCFWSYYEEDIKFSKREKYTPSYDFCSKKVVCLETGMVFKSIQEAKTFIKKGDIHKALNNPTKCAGGYHWEYFSPDKEYEKNIYYGRAPKIRDTRVSCLETNIKYRNIREAEVDTGIHQSHISCCAHGKQVTAGDIIGFLSKI